MLYRITDWDDAYANGAHIPHADTYVPRWTEAAAAFLPGLTLPTEVFLTGLGLAVLLGLLTGIVPAINAQRVKIVTALGKQ